jgi:hypothetical protein
MPNFIDFRQMASELIHADGQIDRPFFTLWIHFGLLARKAQSMDIKENEGFKMAESLFKTICIRTCSSSKFSVVFPVSFALSDRLLISVFLQCIELVCQIQRDLELGLTHWFNWFYLNMAVKDNFEIHQGRYGMAQKSLSPCSGPVHACIYKARKGNWKWFSGSVCVVYFVHTRTEVYYTTNN